jgi:hypothetical protein
LTLPMIFNFFTSAQRDSSPDSWKVIFKEFDEHYFEEEHYFWESNLHLPC